MYMAFLEQAKTWFAFFLLAASDSRPSCWYFYICGCDERSSVFTSDYHPNLVFPFSTIRVDGTGYCSWLRSRNPLVFLFSFGVFGLYHLCRCLSSPCEYPTVIVFFSIDGRLGVLSVRLAWPYQTHLDPVYGRYISCTRRPGDVSLGSGCSGVLQAAWRREVLRWSCCIGRRCLDK